MSCAMVILNYKDSKRAAELALRCAKFKTINHIVIVDNVSDDGSFEKLKKIENEIITVIQSDHNGGFAYGNNYGIKYVINKYSPEFVLLANTDTIFLEKNVEKCIELMKNNSQIALVSTRIQKPSGEEEKSSWKLPNYIDVVKECFWVNRHRNYIKEQKKVYNVSTGFEQVEVVRGSFMFFRVDALQQVDFFDERTFLYGEEIIICKKLKQMDYQVVLLTDLFYVHNHVMVEKTNNDWVSFKRILNSEKYYLIEYCRINSLQQFILGLCINYAVLEWKILLWLKLWKNKNI